MAWEQEIYIAKYKETQTTNSGIQTNVFESPIKYFINHQPISGEMAYKEYGIQVNDIRRAFVSKSQFGGKIKVKDRVYLIDGENYGVDLDTIVSNENQYCNNANYEIVVVSPSNLRMRIDFRKIK